MNEETNNNIAEDNQENTLENQEEESSTENKVENEQSAEQEGIKQLREKYKKEKKEKEELLRYYQYHQYQAQHMQPVQPQQPKEPEEEYDPDEPLTRAQFKREQQKFKKEMEEYKHQVQYSTEQTSLRQRYPDFDDVVTTENVEILRENYPEIATALYKSTDSFNTAASAYTLIKKLGITRGQDPNLMNNRSIDENMKKPRPTASINPSNDALSRAASYQGKFTQEDKKRAYEEMMNVIRNKA